MNYFNTAWRTVSITAVAIAFLIIVPYLFNFFHQASTDVSADLHAVHVQLDRLEHMVSEDIRKDLDKVAKQVEGLMDLNGCTCDKGGHPDQPAGSWFQSSTNPDVYYFGYVSDGILYYYYYSVNGQVVKSKTGPDDIKKSTKNFIAKPVNESKVKIK